MLALLICISSYTLSNVVAAICSSLVIYIYIHTHLVSRHYKIGFQIRQLKRSSSPIQVDFSWSVELVNVFYDWAWSIDVSSHLPFSRFLCKTTSVRSCLNSLGVLADFGCISYFTNSFQKHIFSKLPLTTFEIKWFWKLFCRAENRPVTKQLLESFSLKAVKWVTFEKSVV